MCVTEIPIDASTADATDGSTPSSVRCGDAALIRTDFGDGLPWWASTDAQDGGSVSAEAGVLRIEVPSEAGKDAWLGDSYHTTLLENRFVVKVGSVIAAEPLIRWIEGDRIELFVRGSELVGEIDIVGKPITNNSIPYQPLEQRFWSIAEADGQLSLEVSPDGVDWVVVHSQVEEINDAFGHFDVGARSLGVVGSAEFDNINGGEAPDTVACAVSSTETFADSVLEPDFTSSANEDCAPTIAGGTLQMTLSGAGGATPSCILDTAFRVDLREATFGIEFEGFPEYTLDMFHSLRLRSVDGDAHFDVSDAGLQARLCATNCLVLSTVPIDASRRFLRFREQPAGTLIWETSADGATWNELASAADAINLGAVQVEHRFGSNSASSAVLRLNTFGPLP